jgi:hypothetical protein
MEHNNSMGIYKRLIFLDIDGVLNHYLYNILQMLDVRFSLAGLNPMAVGLLSLLCSEGKAGVVISATLRKTVPEQRIASGFQEYYGFKIPVIGATRSLSHSLHGSRGKEIQDFLERYQATYGEIERYIILDDSRDMLEEQLPYLIRTDNLTGLDLFAFRDALNLLNPDSQHRKFIDAHINYMRGIGETNQLLKYLVPRVVPYQKITLDLDNISQRCKALCQALEELDGVIVRESDCGFDVYSLSVDFQVDSVECLLPIVKAIDPKTDDSYAHWKLETKLPDSSLYVSPIVFRLHSGETVGEIAYYEADKLAERITLIANSPEDRK